MNLSEVINGCSWTCPDENGKTHKSIPRFKKDFSKEVKTLWEMFENPEDKTHEDLLNNLSKLEGLINCLKHDVYDLEQYSK